jgi:hypothetical protein
VRPPFFRSRRSFKKIKTKFKLLTDGLAIQDLNYVVYSWKFVGWLKYGDFSNDFYPVVDSVKIIYVITNKIIRMFLNYTRITLICTVVQTGSFRTTGTFAKSVMKYPRTSQKCDEECSNRFWWLEWHHN